MQKNHVVVKSHPLNLLITVVMLLLYIYLYIYLILFILYTHLCSVLNYHQIR